MTSAERIQRYLTNAPNSFAIQQWINFINTHADKDIQSITDDPASWRDWKEKWNLDLPDSIYFEGREAYAGFQEQIAQEDANTNPPHSQTQHAASHAPAHQEAEKEKPDAATSSKQPPNKQPAITATPPGGDKTGEALVDKVTPSNAPADKSLISQQVRQVLPEDPEAKLKLERKESAKKIIQRYFQENPVVFQDALLDKHLPSDPRYKQIKDELENEWTSKYDPLNNRMRSTDAYIEYVTAIDKYKNGSLDGSPSRTLEDDARERFMKNHVEAANEFYQKEKTQIYPSAHNDPMWSTTYRQLNTILNGLDNPQWKRQYQPALEELGSLEIADIGRQEYARQFVETFPEKAQAYAKVDQNIENALQEVETEAVETQGNQGESISPLFTPIPTTMLLEQNNEDDERETQDDNSQSRIRDIKRLKERLERIQGEAPSAPQRIEKPRMRQPTRNMRPPSGESPRGLLRRGVQNAANRGTRMAANGTKAAGKIAARGARLAAQVASKAGVLFENPYSIAILVAIIIIIFIIILIFIIINNNDNQPGSSSVPLTISKSVDKAEIPNPSPNTAGENLTYAINVSYPGSAQDIITTDPLPDNAEFVGATGNPELLDSGGNIASDPAKIRTIRWSAAKSQPQSSASASIAPSANVNVINYTKPPFSLPPPNGPSDAKYGTKVIDNLNQLGSLVAKHQDFIRTKVKYADPFLSVVWSGAIEGTGGDNYTWNCKDIPGTINQGCPGGFSSGSWQVGYGIQVSQAVSQLAAVFDAVYGTGASQDPAKVQQIGQAVVDGSGSAKGGKITNPASFPSVTISQLVTSAQGGNESSQQAVALLLMDKEVGAVTTALEVAGDIGNNWRASMEGWGSYYSKNMQNFSNRMQELALKYTGSGGGTSFPPQTYTLVLRPKPGVSDTYLINQAASEIIGAAMSNTAQAATGITLGDLVIKKEFLPLPNEGNCKATVTESCGRPGRTVVPRKIVLHTTWSPSPAEEIVKYFASGAENRGVGSHFVVGKDGTIIQLVPLLGTTVEVAYAVANYSDHISIEIVNEKNFENKAQVPPAQYAAVLKLVKALMQQYRIPLGEKDSAWISSTDEKNSVTEGLYGVLGHYQLNPSNRTDPGIGFQKEIRAELQSGLGL